MADWMLNRRVLPWLVTLGAFLMWEGVVRTFQIQAFILPAPSLVATTLVAQWEPILQHSLQTLMTTLVGLGLAIGFGVLLGLAVGASEKSTPAFIR